MKKINYVITLFFILTSSLLSAQSHNEEVTVEGSYTPQIIKSERISMTPDMPQRDFNIPNYVINTDDFTYKYKAELEPISPVNYISNDKTNICNNFIKAGFGTRLSPDFLFRHYSNISKKTSLGVAIDHNSTWLDMKDYANSKYMNNAFGLSMTNRFSHFQLHSHIDYHYDMYYINSTDSDSDSDTLVNIGDINARKIHSLNAYLVANNNKSSYKSLYDEFSLIYSYSGIQGGMQENLVKFKAHLEHSNSWFQYSKGTQTLIADINAELSNIGQTLLLLAINPHLDLNGDFYSLRLGLRADVKTNSTSIGGIYPDIKGSLYLFQRNIEFYAGIGGKTKINTLKEILAENPFVVSNPLNYAEFDYEKTKLDFQGGVKFKALNMISGNVGVRYRMINNHIFFINSSEQQGTFDIILNDCHLFNLNADLHVKINDNINVVADFAYNKYNFSKAYMTDDAPVTRAHAWYEPEIEFTLKGFYQMNEHWKFNLATYLEGKRYALTGNSYNDIKELKPIVDIQLGCDYNLNKNLAFYAEIKNLIHNKYQMYYNYPSYGIQGFVGFKYRFL